jgi:hypothetical protein
MPSGIAACRNMQEFAQSANSTRAFMSYFTPPCGVEEAVRRAVNMSGDDVKRKKEFYMKRVVLCVCVFVVLGAALAAQTASDFVTIANDNGTVTITKYTGEATTVVIPAAIDGKPVVAIGGWAAFSGSKLTSVTIPNSITSIGQGAFDDTPLTSVTIPNSVTTIEDYAFRRTKLTSVTIPNSVTTIGNYAFYRTPLTSVTIPNSVTTIGNGAFSSCSNLRTITVDSKNSAFSSADGVLFSKDKKTLLTYPGGKANSYTIPNGVTTIGESAFSSPSLTSVTIPNSVTTIGDYAFWGTKLTNVTIPNSVTSIGGNAFARAQLTSVTIPNSVKSIGGGAFEENQLTSVSIPAGVKNIGYLVFRTNPITTITAQANADGLSAYDLPGEFDFIYEQQGKKAGTYTMKGSNYNGLLDIAAWQLNGASLNGLIIGKYTGKESAFQIPERINGQPVIAIGSAAFQRWSTEVELTSITIPSTVVYIGGYAFNANKLTQVTIPKSVTRIAGMAFYGNSINKLVLVDGLVSIGSGAFCSNKLTSVTIPSTVRSIEDGAFAGNELSGTKIPETVTSVGKDVFSPSDPFGM